MRYLIAVILPPIAVWNTNRPVQAFVNVFLCTLGWIPGVLHALYVTQRGPMLATPEDVTKFVLKNFGRVGTADFSNLERIASKMNARSNERGLLYALRVSSVLPTLKNIKTLESRWQTANCGAASGGLLDSRKARNYKKTRKFLEAEYLTHANRILATEEAQFLSKLHSASTEKARKTAVNSWIAKLRGFKNIFMYELPGFMPLVDTYIQRAEPQQVGDGKPDPASS